MTLKRYLPLLILTLLIATAYAFGLQKHLTLDVLRDNRAILSQFVSQNLSLAALAFVGVYTSVVTLSLPAASLMTVTGGFLFGVPLGAVLSTTGATLGCAIFFTIARATLLDVMRKKAGPLVTRMAAGFAGNSFNYLLSLRLIPVFPFWVVNLAAALLGMRLPLFVAATAIGIVPGVIISATFGAGLGDVFDRGGDVTLKSVFNPSLLAALLGLALLSLAPVMIKAWRVRTE